MCEYPKAGNELDAMVAEHVMGINVLGETWCWFSPADPSPSVRGIERENHVLLPVYLNHCSCEYYRTDEIQQEFPELLPEIVFGHYAPCLEAVIDYSTDIAAAWQVVEKMHTLDYEFLLQWIPSAVAYCQFDKPCGEGEAVGPICQAICHAALAALEMG